MTTVHPRTAAAKTSRASAPTDTGAPIMAVFASIQGEGAYVGEPQTFVRLEGCPLRCRWCDTPGSWLVSEARTGGLPTARPQNWTDAHEIANHVRRIEGVRPRTVSITGGEPLLWPEFVRELAAELAPRRIHLETAGAHPEALAAVMDAVDHVSLDLKLPEDLDAPEEVSWSQAEPAPADADAWVAVRRRVLSLVAGHDACGKLILSAGRTQAEFSPLLDDVVELAPDLPIIVQPVSPTGGVAAPDRSAIEALVDDVLARELTVRVLPQVHRVLRLP